MKARIYLLYEYFTRLFIIWIFYD